MCLPRVISRGPGGMLHQQPLPLLQQLTTQPAWQEDRLLLGPGEVRWVFETVSVTLPSVMCSQIHPPPRTAGANVLWHFQCKRRSEIYCSVDPFLMKAQAGPSSRHTASALLLQQAFVAHLNQGPVQHLSQLHPHLSMHMRRLLLLLQACGRRCSLLLLQPHPHPQTRTRGWCRRGGWIHAASLPPHSSSNNSSLRH